MVMKMLVALCTAAADSLLDFEQLGAEMQIYHSEHGQILTPRLQMPPETYVHGYNLLE